MAKKTSETSETEAAVLAGGCFWCLEPPFDALEGVVSTTVGYAGGSAEDAQYSKVSIGATDHYEAIEVKYDPSKVNYKQILELFFRNIDPTDAGGQFCDRGHHYTTAVFVSSDEQQQIAQKAVKEINESGRFQGPIMTKIIRSTEFFPAEEYHQDFYKKSPIRYKSYRLACGRDERLSDLWKD